MLPPREHDDHVAVAEAFRDTRRARRARPRPRPRRWSSRSRPRARPRPRCAARVTTSRSSTSAPTISRVSCPTVVTAMPSAIVGPGRGAGPRPSACDHARVALDLHADDVDVGAPALRRDGDAGHEPAATDRHDDRVDVGNGVEDLQADGALARDDLRRRRTRARSVAPLSAAASSRRRERAGEVGAGEHHLGLVDLGARDLRERRVGGHHDRRRDPEPVRVVGEALRVVAGRRGDDARGPRRVRERRAGS